MIDIKTLKTKSFRFIFLIAEQLKNNALQQKAKPHPPALYFSSFMRRSMADAV